jgi:hypothetical protein
MKNVNQRPQRAELDPAARELLEGCSTPRPGFGARGLSTGADQITGPDGLEPQKVVRRRDRGPRNVGSGASSDVLEQDVQRFVM